MVFSVFHTLRVARLFAQKIKMFIPFIFMFAHITLTVSQYYDYRPHVVDMQHDSLSEYEGQEKLQSTAAPLEGT